MNDRNLLFNIRQGTDVDLIRNTESKTLNIYAGVTENQLKAIPPTVERVTIVDPLPDDLENSIPQTVKTIDRKYLSVQAQHQRDPLQQFFEEIINDERILEEIMPIPGAGTTYNEVDALKRQLNTTEQLLWEKHAQLDEKDKRLRAKDTRIKERDDWLKEKDDQLQAKDAIIQALQAQLNSANETLNQQLAQVKQIKDLTKQVLGKGRKRSAEESATPRSPLLNNSAFTSTTTTTTSEPSSSSSQSHQHTSKRKR